MSNPQFTSRDWFGKVSAAFIAGFALSIAFTVLFCDLADVKDSFFDARGQMAMWAVAPIWVGLLSFCFLFRSGARAWSWLLGANLLVWTALVLLRSASGV